MLSPEAAKRFREMSVADRLRLTMQMIDEAVPYLTRGTPEQIKRRFALIRAENDDRNAQMLEAFARTKIVE